MTKISTGIIALAIKIGPKLLAVAAKLAKVAKVGKMGLAVGSVAAYSYLFTWQFAVIIMVSLFFHESGHIWAMKRCGLKTKGIYFIPFMGAAAVSEDMFKSRRDEVYIAAMGPIWGFILAIGTACVYFVTGNAFFAAAAGWMAMINLFNLLPINPLDGGRIMKSIAFSINSRLGIIFLVVGIIISMIFIFWARIYLFLILLFIGSMELLFENRSYNKYKSRVKELVEFSNNKEVKERLDNDMLTRIEELKQLITPSMSKTGIVVSAVAYVIIIAVLWILMTYLNHIPEVEIARELFMS